MIFLFVKERLIGPCPRRSKCSPWWQQEWFGQCSQRTISAKKNGGAALWRYLIKAQKVAPVWPDSVRMQERSRFPFLRLLGFKLAVKGPRFVLGVRMLVQNQTSVFATNKHPPTTSKPLLAYTSNLTTWHVWEHMWRSWHFKLHIVPAAGRKGWQFKSWIILHTKVALEAMTVTAIRNGKYLLQVEYDLIRE